MRAGKLTKFLRENIINPNKLPTIPNIAKNSGTIHTNIEFKELIYMESVCHKPL